MAKQELTVRVLLSQWAYSDVEPPLVLAGGEHTVKADAKLLKAIGSAVAAGSLELVKAPRGARAQATKHLGDEKAEAKAYDARIADEKYQAKLDVVRDEYGPALNANHARLQAAIEAGDEDEFNAAVQEKVELEADYHHAIAEVK